jgi:hypothetical protein
MATMSFVLIEKYNGYEKVKENVTFAPCTVIRLSIVVLLHVEFPSTQCSLLSYFAALMLNLQP